ncbi:MAG: hypothetical protein ACRD3N_04415 [Terracidiphilus sp.]
MRASLLKRVYEVVLGGLLLAASLLFLVFSIFRDVLNRGRQLRNGRRKGAASSFEEQAAGEFSFDRAIPAYEELIDTVAAEKRK